MDVWSHPLRDGAHVEDLTSLRKLNPYNLGVEIMISITEFTCREKKRSEDGNLTSLERFCLRWRDLVFAGKKKKVRLGEDKSLTSPNILGGEENQSRNQLSLEDEDIDEVDVQKLKNEDSKGKKTTSSL